MLNVSGGPHCNHIAGTFIVLLAASLTMLTSLRHMAYCQQCGITNLGKPFSNSGVTK